MRNYKKGELEFFIRKLTLPEIEPYLREKWDEGYLAFSCKEEIYTGKEDLIEFIRGRFDNGYLMEIGLWRKKDSGYEEINIERIQGLFRLHYFKLTIPPQKANCFYREVRIPARKNSIFGRFLDNFSGLEIIYPSYRIHIFMTIPSYSGGIR